MGEISFDKQSLLIDADSLTKLKLKMFGVGSMGSIIVKMAALTGITDISVYDYDTVDPDNIGSRGNEKDRGNTKTNEGTL